MPIYFVALHLTVISYRPSWRTKLRDLICVFICRASSTERNLLIGIKIRFHWYLLLPRSVIFSIFSGYEFDPSHLDQAGENCENTRETLYSYFQNVAKVSNANLIQNVYALIKKKNIDHASLKWAPSVPQAKVNYSKFSLSFS